MNPDFERWRRDLTEPGVTAFEAFCFHRADEVAAPYTALMNAPALRGEKAAKAIADRVFDAANGNYDIERLVNALADALEGPGCMPGLVRVNAMVDGYYDVIGRCIYKERGSPFTLQDLGPPLSRGLTSDPEYYFEDLRGSETNAFFNFYHLTEPGLEFAQWLWPERIEQLKKAEEARAR